MSVPIRTNRYRFPNGYRGYIAFQVGAGSFVPWNGYNNGVNTPNSTILGAVIQIVAAGVPADTSVLQLNFGDSVFKFQFLYAGTPGTQPTAVSVPLPNSGASTAAQVKDALLAVLQLTGALNQAGGPVYYPWLAQSVNATTLRINLNNTDLFVGGSDPANITTTSISAPTLGYTGIGASHGIPGTIGKLGAFLPGP